VEAILAYFLGWEADALFLTALLTVIGFSVHDTIVVFDRIRENSHVYRRVPYEPLVNHSIVQTLDRSINTQLTVMFTLFALVLFGGESIRHFVIILLVGIFSGTYSSIFNASPILVVWENQEWKNWFRRPATAQ
jgi:Preprotein translocase subunit SecF